MEEETEHQSAQAEHVKKQLDSRLSEIQTLQQLLSKSESDSRVTEEALAQAQELISTLQSELDFLRRNGQVQRSTLQKNLSHVETELSKQNGEYLQKMRQLEVKNKHLQDLADSQKSQLDYLKQEIVELQTMNRQSEEARIALLQTRGETTEEQVSTTPKSTKIQASRPKRVSPYDKTAKPSLHKTEDGTTNPHFPQAENDFFESTETAGFGHRKPRPDEEGEESRLEREISAYNQQYKTLLHRSQEPGADLASLRVELNSVATAMEAKSNHLYAVKKQKSFSRDKPSFYV
jgi:chromosome segregation ATPase